MSKKIKAKEYMNWGKTITNDLTPLEAFISLRTRLLEKGIKDQFLEELITIETALKDYEELEIAHKKLVKDVQETSEFYSMKLRALDVIKKELSLEFEFREQEYPFDNYLIIIKSGYEHIVIGMPKNKASKERYNLLKEVLL